MHRIVLRFMSRRFASGLSDERSSNAHCEMRRGGLLWRKRAGSVANLIIGHYLTPRLHKVLPGATLTLWLLLSHRV